AESATQGRAPLADGIEIDDEFGDDASRNTSYRRGGAAPPHPERGVGVRAGHARVPERTTPEQPVDPARDGRGPAPLLPAEFSLRLARRGHLAREEVRAGRPALPLLARRRRDLRGGGQRQAPRRRARIPEPPRGGHDRPQLLRSATTPPDPL